MYVVFPIVLFSYCACFATRLYRLSFSELFSGFIALIVVFFIFSSFSSNSFTILVYVR